MLLARAFSIFLSEVDMPEVPDVIKISDDGNHETFQITHERYLSSVRVPEREQDQAYIPTESWITFDEHMSSPMHSINCRHWRSAAVRPRRASPSGLIRIVLTVSVAAIAAHY